MIDKIINKQYLDLRVDTVLHFTASICLPHISFMCTVTYLPYRSSGYILTSNRDESPFRKPAVFPQRQHIGAIKLLFPRDGEAGGSWMITSNKRTSLCLLNGAFSPYNITDKAPNSRGQILFDFFSFPIMEDFLNYYDCTRFLPFTLIIVSSVPQRELIELRWDGTHKYIEWYETNQPHIWSSAMLYPPDVIAQRKIWFQEWLQRNKLYDTQDIRHFHHFGGRGNIRTNMVMQVKDRIQTVSISTVEASPNRTNFYYKDLREGNEEVERLIIK